MTRHDTSGSPALDDAPAASGTRASAGGAGDGSLLSWDLAAARQHRLTGSFAGDSRRAPLRYLALGVPAARAAALAVGVKVI